MPHPLLESDICECSHKGKVIFPSSHQNFLLVTEAGILTPSDLSKAKIIGCTNPIIKGGPCSKLVSIPESITTNLLIIENEKAVLAECNSQVLTDKGSPIFLQGEPKAKGILEIEQDSIQETQQETKQHIQDSNSFYPYYSSYPHLASNEKNAGVKELREGEEENQKEKYSIDKEGYLQGLDIIKYPITRLEFSLVNGFKPKAIVLHRTDSSTAKSTLESWNNPNSARVGTHFLIDKDGTIYQCASLYKYTQHIGNIKAKDLELHGKDSNDYLIYKGKTYQQVSDIEKTKQYPDRYPINNDSIGIEVVGRFLGNDKKLSKYDKVFKYTQLSGEWEEVAIAQKNSIKALIESLQTIFNLNDDDIYKHGAISGHKQASEGEGIL